MNAPVRGRFAVPVLDESQQGPNSLRSMGSSDDGEALDAYSQAVTGVAEMVGPAVVRLDVKRRLRARDPHGNEVTRDVGGSGSGFVFTPDGLIATNSHVVSGAVEIGATFNDGQTIEESMIGDDPDTDLAVIRVPGHKLPSVPVGQLRSPRRGPLRIA